MADTTPRFGLPYAELDDPPDGATLSLLMSAATEGRLAFAGAQGGRSVVNAEQAISSTDFALAGTPDRVQNLVVPNDGDLIVARFSALMRPPLASLNSITAALTVNLAQLKTIADPGAPAAQQASAQATDLVSHPGYTWVFSSPVAGGLAAGPLTSGDADDTNTGMVVPGAPIYIERLPAGTYTISVVWKVSGGTGHVKKRRLEAWTKEFPTSGI